MFQKNGEFSKSELEQLLRRPEAQALLARLQQLDPAALQNAAHSFTKFSICPGRADCTRIYASCR